MRKKYDDETLEKVYYYYSLAGNRMLTAAQAADCLNLSESSLFRVMADFRENISKEAEEQLIKKYQDVDIHSVLTIKEQPKNYSTEKNILEDIAITLAEILASVNELKQYIMEKDSSEHNIQQEESFLKEETDEIEQPAWEELEIYEQEQESTIKESTETPKRKHETIWTGETEPTLKDEEKEIEKIKKEENIITDTNKETNMTNHTLEEESIQLDETTVICITQLNHMCKEINDLVPRESMEKMWNDWERICRGYGSRINPIYQRNWNQIMKKTKENVTENTIKNICDAQAEQMKKELKVVSSQERIKDISYTYYNWIRQVFEMCYLVQAPMSQEKTKTLYTNYLTILKNVSSDKIEQMHH